MKIEIKNSDLKLSCYFLAELLTTDITIGTKNRVQKVVKKLQPHFNAFHASHVELLKKHGGITDEKGVINLPDPKNTTPEWESEWKELADQTNTIEFDPIDFKKIEDVKTTAVFDMELISKFFENYE